MQSELAARQEALQQMAEESEDEKVIEYTADNCVPPKCHLRVVPSNSPMSNNVNDAAQINRDNIAYGNEAAPQGAPGGSGATFFLMAAVAAAGGGYFFMQSQPSQQGYAAIDPSASKDGGEPNL